MKSFIIAITFVISELGVFAQPIKIIPLKKLDYTDTTKDKTITSHFDNYLVRGYKDSKASIADIDKFISQIPADTLKKYTRYTITFFKESTETNGNTINDYPKKGTKIFYGKDDLIFEYSWEGGLFLARYKYKNNELIESKLADDRVKIKPLPVDSIPCSFLENVKFKNGRDTVVVKAVLRDIVEAPPRFLKTKPSAYKYKFDSYIVFQPENCPKSYSKPLLTSAVVKEDFLDSADLGVTVYITCVIFNERFLSFEGDYDGVVIKVTPAIETPIALPKKCNFLYNLYFKHGTDSIEVKAKFYAVFKPGTGLIIHNLSKSRLLIADNYDYDIAFQVEGCDEKFMAPYHFKSVAEKDLLEKQPEGSPIYLTCMAFQKYYSYGMPFFIIEKFRLPEH